MFITEICFEVGTISDIVVQIQPISTPCINTNDPWSALVVKIEIKEATYGIYGFSFPKVWSTSAMRSIFYLEELATHKYMLRKSSIQLSSIVLMRIQRWQSNAQIHVFWNFKRSIVHWKLSCQDCCRPIFPQCTSRKILQK